MAKPPDHDDHSAVDRHLSFVLQPTGSQRTLGIPVPIYDSETFNDANVNQTGSQPVLKMISPSRDNSIKCSGGASINNSLIEDEEECIPVNTGTGTRGTDDDCCGGD